MPGHVPEWYRNAKFGIMVHWGLPSIPAFAPAGHGTIADILSAQDWQYYFRNNPYSEWYLNTLRLGDTETRKFHNRRFNPRYRYERLARLFNDDLKKWQPEEWADLFQEAGARYVVMVAKHHDGFLMWPSDQKPEVNDYVAARDVVGELGAAVRAKDLRYGVYYSGLLDWTVQSEPIADFNDLMNVRTDPAYCEYVRNHYRELITRHKPDILWNDIGLPAGVSRRDLFQLYRETVADGVLNDRWSQVSPGMGRLLSWSPIRRMAAAAARKSIIEGAPIGKLGDVPTAEYCAEPKLQARPLEAVRSIGNSFALNLEEGPENYMSGIELARMLVDVVSKNGNLLLNVGPASDGTIPREQLKPLLELAAWLRINGEAIYDTRPWRRAEGRTGDGQQIRFTSGNKTLFAILLDRPIRLTVSLPKLDLKQIMQSEPSPEADREVDATVLGCEYPVSWRIVGDSVEVRLPGAFVPAGPVVIAFRWRTIEPRARPIELYTDVIG